MLPPLVNNPPVITSPADGTAYCAAPYIPITICLEANDPDGDNVAICDLETLSNCNINEINDLCFVYVALPLQAGLDVVTVTVCDDGNPILTDVININVNVGCGTPIANKDVIRVDMNGATFNGSAASYNNGVVSGNPLTNDDANDACNDGLTLTSIVSGPANGSAMIVGGQVQYQPNAGFSGTDQITYQICNDCGNCVNGLINVEADLELCENVFNTCTSPITPVDICVDFCNAPGASITEVETTFDCSITITPPTCFTYIPLPGLTGTDQITVTGVNSAGVTDVATVYVDVDGCGGVRVADDAGSTLQERSVTINVLANDESSYSWDKPTIEQAPVYGSARVNLDGTITYFPNQHYYGLDEFSYNICDEKGQCGSAKVGLVVEEVLRTLPTLYDDLISAYASVATTIDVLVNDITPNNEDLTIVAVTPALNGAVEIVDNAIIYTSNEGFIGNDRVDYIACDAIGNCETARVSISVIPEVIESVEEIVQTGEETTVEDGEQQAEETVEEVEQIVETGEIEEEEEVIENVDAFEIVNAFESSDLIKIEFTNTVDEQVQYRLIDLAGRTRVDGKLMSIYGKNYLEINSSTLEKGVFVIYLNNNRESEYRKIFIH